MATERAIHFAIFILLLIGLGALSAWVSYAYLRETLILEIAGIALSWGVILLFLYASFITLNWKWWMSPSTSSEPPQKKKEQSRNK